MSRRIGLDLVGAQGHAPWTEPHLSSNFECKCNGVTIDSCAPGCMGCEPLLFQQPKGGGGELRLHVAQEMMSVAALVLRRWKFLGGGLFHFCWVNVWRGC